MLKYTLPAVPMTATTNAAARQLAAQLLGKWPVLCSNEVESVISFQSFEADYNWLMPTAHSGGSNWLTEKWGQKKEGRRLILFLSAPIFLSAFRFIENNKAATRHPAAQLFGEWPVLCSNEVESVISFQSFEADYNWLMRIAHSGGSNWLTEKWGQKKEGRRLILFLSAPIFLSAFRFIENNIENNSASLSKNSRLFAS